MGGMSSEYSLRLLPEILVNDPLMLSGVEFTFMRNIAVIDRTFEQGIQGTAREGPAGFSGLVFLIQDHLNRFDTAMNEIQIIDPPDFLGLALVLTS